MKTLLILITAIIVTGCLKETYWIEKNLNWEKETFTLLGETYSNFFSKGRIIQFKDDNYCLILGTLTKNDNIKDSLCIDIAEGGCIYNGKFEKMNEQLYIKSTLSSSNLIFRIDSNKGIDTVRYDNIKFTKDARELILNDTLVFIPLKEAIYTECKQFFK